MVARKKYKTSSGDHAEESSDVVPFDGVAKIKNGEDAEDGQRDDFLGNFELSRGIDVAAPAVGGDLQHVFKKGDSPACDDDEPDGFVLEFQMTVPGESHEDVRAGQEEEREKSGLGDIVHIDCRRTRFARRRGSDALPR
jgi:hypothetical protein